MRRIIATGLTLAICTNAWAGRWCDVFNGVDLPVAIICDDFDHYCEGFNNPCPKDPNYDLLAGRAWPRNSWSYYNNQDGVCGNAIILSSDQAQLTSQYHGGVMMNGGDEAGTLGQSTRMLTNGIAAKFGSGYNRVYGTDDAGLVVEFDVACKINSAAALQLSNGYVELALEEQELTKQQFLNLGYDPEVTPTDFIKVGGPDIMQSNCISCWGQCKNLGATDGRAPHHAWPTICQSYDARTASSLCPNPNGGDPIPCGPPYCPETPANKLHKTMAIGVLALLDPNPCHCENPVKPSAAHCGDGPGCNLGTGFCNSTGGSSRPCSSNADCPKELHEYTDHTNTNKHVAFFDGWKWRSLSSKIFDDGQGGGIPGVIGSGNFRLGHKIDHIKLTIKAETVKIEHWHVQNRSDYVLYAGNPICEPDAKRNDTIAGGVTITNPGSGYSSAPTVTVAAPPSGRRATVAAVVSGGSVVALTITDPGMGYTSPPAITIAPPPSGVQATATTILGGSAYYLPGEYSWADNIPRKYFGGFNAIRLGTSSNCRLCSSDLVNAGGDYANCGTNQWDGSSYVCTEYNQNWNAGATRCKRMSGINGCYGTNIDDGADYVTIDNLVLNGGTPDTNLGACCYPNGTCAFQNESQCTGTFLGAGSTCIGTPCEGACCGTQGSCEVTNMYACNGRFRGSNTNCSSPCCPSPFADWDGDGDVDMDDFAKLQSCLTSVSGNLPADCACFDRNNDKKINQDDVILFTNCATGASIVSDVVPAECEP